MACVPFLFTGAHAEQQWPSRSIRLVVPFPAGGASDTLARSIGERLTSVFGQTVVVENKTGAGGVIGADSVAKATPDGYTLLLATIATHAINPALRPDMPYDAAKDFEPVILLGSVPNVILAGPSATFKSLDDLVRQAKASPGAVAYASAGTGTSQHLSGELFQLATGVHLNHIPYRGGPNAIQDVMGGMVPMSFETVLLAAPQEKAGRVRAIAVTSARRSNLLPEVPTLQELGVKDFDVSSWQGIWAPRGTPPEIVARLNAEIGRILGSDAMKAKMGELGMTYEPNTPEEFAAYQQAEQQKWARVIKDGNVKLD